MPTRVWSYALAYTWTYVYVNFFYLAHHFLLHSSFTHSCTHQMRLENIFFIFFFIFTMNFSSSLFKILYLFLFHYITVVPMFPTEQFKFFYVIAACMRDLSSHTGQIICQLNGPPREKITMVLSQVAFLLRYFRHCYGSSLSCFGPVTLMNSLWVCINLMDINKCDKVPWLLPV